MAARTTKKDLESKIALLEKKLQKLTDSVDLQKTSPKPASVKPKGTLPKGTAPKPTPEYVKPKGTLPKTTASAPKPAPAQTKPKGTMPKGFTPESASKPKPAETKNAPTNMAQALEKAYENWPMTSTADFGLDADSGVKPFGIVPLGFVCAMQMLWFLVEFLWVLHIQV